MASPRSPRTPRTAGSASFDRLLQCLAEEHDREVQSLQEEIARLQRSSAQATTTTGSTTSSQGSQGSVVATPRSVADSAAANKDPSNSPVKVGKSSPRHLLEVPCLPSCREVSEGALDFSEEMDLHPSATPPKLWHGSLFLPEAKETQMGMKVDSRSTKNGVKRSHGDTMPIAAGVIEEVDDNEESTTSLEVPSPRSMESNNCSNWRSLIDLVDKKVNDPEHIPGAVVGDAWLKALKVQSEKDRASQDLDIGNVFRFLKSDMLVRDSYQQQIESYHAQKANRILACLARCRCMHPNSLKRMAWDFLSALILLHDVVMIPMQFFDIAAEGDITSSGLPTNYRQGVLVFDLFQASFWTIDISISFCTGYHSSQGFIELRPVMVARNYMRTWLSLDVLLVAVDWVSFFLNVSAQTQALRLSKSASRVMRVFRLLRFMKLNTQVQDFLSMINSEYIQALIGIAKILVIIVFVNHYVACFWFALAVWDPVGENRTWVQKYLLKEGAVDAGCGFAYTTSMHWSLTQFTPASMEVFPVNWVERTYNIVVIIAALVVFSSFVSSITSTMTHIRNINIQKSEQEAAVRGFFNEHKIPVKLATRVWRFIHHNGTTVKRRTRQEEVKALQHLPENIRDELRQAVFIPVLTVHPLFRELQRVEPEAINEICKVTMSEVTLGARREMPGDWTDQKDMLFVVRGNLVYSTCFEDSPHGKVKEGQWACEAAIWLSKASLEGPFVGGESGTEVVALNGHRFARVAHSHPPCLLLLANYAMNFVERFNCAQFDTTFDTVLFNDTDIVEDLLERSLTAQYPKKLKWMPRLSARTSSQRGSLASNAS